MTDERRTARDAADAKQAVRERVWAAMTDAGVVGFPGAVGRIPNFTGAGDAARRLADHDAWIGADILKANPDMAQLPVRAAALSQGKLLYLAVPRLTKAEPFVRLDPAAIDAPARTAASIKGSARFGVPVRPEELTHLDLVVCGTVAVSRHGVRVGKGGGYSDLEFALAAELGLVDETTTIVTTVHPLQVLDEDLPETCHDFRVDLVVTPDEVIEVPDAARHRPPGVIWEHLDEDKIASIPVLARAAAGRR